MKRLLLLALATLTAGRLPQDATAVRFAAVDVFVDSGSEPLAAWQVDLRAIAGDVRIAGIEGGDAPAFAEAPFYDPRAMQHEHVILAAFSTRPGAELPAGRTRVARVHVQVTGAIAPHYELRLTTAAGADGRELTAHATWAAARR